MRKLLIFAAILAVPVTVAEAKCTKKSLNGSWAMGAGTESGVGVMSGGSFNVVIDGTVVNFTLSSFSSTKCKGSGTGSFDGSPGTVKLVSEAIASSSSKPNHLLLTMDVPPFGLIQLPLQRQ